MLGPSVSCVCKELCWSLCNCLLTTVTCVCACAYMCVCVCVCVCVSSTGALTKLGERMAAFPLAPVFAYTVLRAKEFGCTLEIVTLVALLSADNVFYTPREDRVKAGRARRK